MGGVSVAEQINEWQIRLRRAEDRVAAVENDLRFYRSERDTASRILARLRVQQRTGAPPKPPVGASGKDTAVAPLRGQSGVSQ